MLFILQRVIYEWCLFAEDIIMLARNIIYIIYGFRKYVRETSPYKSNPRFAPNIQQKMGETLGWY